MSGTTITPQELQEAVEIRESQSGNTTRTLVPIPEQVTDAWGLKYNEYVRVSIGSSGSVPYLAVAPMRDMSYRQRNNDLKLTSNEAIALPRRIVRAFGLAGDVWWEEFGNQLVGTLTEYSDSGTLFAVADYYGSQKLSQDETSRISFRQLQDVADDTYTYTESEPYGITMHRGSFRHTLPDDIGLKEDDERVFLLFHDGSEFVIGLIPYDGDSAKDDTPFFSNHYNPMKASPESHTENLPSVLLDYEKDKVVFHRNSNETLYYTVPKQVASSLWLDDGYISDWIKIGSAYFAQLIPEDRDITERRVKANSKPN